MKLNDVLFVDSLPTLDLHGYDALYAQIKINEFIKDNYLMGNSNLVIVHGIGSGVIRHTTHDTLKKNKLVADYQIFAGNVGMTIVELVAKDKKIVNKKGKL